MKQDVIVKFNGMNIQNNNLENYKNPGVWALWGEDKVGKKVCLEVGQTLNIYKEINSALYILSHDDNERCKKCNDTYFARRRYEYSARFMVHKCKGCEFESDLRIKSWKRSPRYIDKYKDMILNYNKFEFIPVNISHDMNDKGSRLEIEKEYAQKKQALYWWG